MQEEKLKNRIMMRFMDEGFLLSNAIETMSDSSLYTSKLMTKLLNDALIANRKITIKDNNRKVAVTYKAITQKGIQWVRDNCSEEHPWLNYLPNPIPSCNLSQTSNNENLYRLLKSITVSIIFKNFGIKTVLLKRNIDNDKSFKKMVVTAKEQYYKEIGSKEAFNNPSKNEDAYYHSRDIHSYFNLTSEDIKQQAFSSHIGLLLSHSVPYFIYASSHSNLNLKKSSVNRARTSATKMLLQNGFTVDIAEVCRRGIIFCKNKKEWEKVFRQNINKVEKKKTVVLSGLFKFLYLLPINRDSMYALDAILYYKDSLEDTVQKALLDNDTGFDNSWGRLKFHNCETEIGVDMDLVKLQRLYNMSKSEDNRNKTYVVVCYEWQEEYYKTVMPDNVKYYKIKNNYF